MIQTLSTTSLKEVAPAIFSSSYSTKLSDKYSFVPTMEIIEKFENEGWKVMSASQLGKGQFNPHEVRFGNGQLAQVGDSVLQAIVQNSHNGTRQLTIGAGLYRLVCSNGLTIPTSVADEITIRHKGIDMGEVRRITDQFAERLPLITNSVNKFQTRELSDTEVVDFVNQSAIIRWASGSIPTFNMGSFLEPQRDGDVGNTMWKVFNRVQEKFVRGGEVTRNQRGRQGTMRSLRSFDTVNRINTKLWELADSFC